MQRDTGPRYNVALMAHDMAAKGWRSVDVAARCRPRTANSSVTRFLNGEVQTAPMAKRIAKALGRSVSRYLLPVKSDEAIAS